MKHKHRETIIAISLLVILAVLGIGGTTGYFAYSDSIYALLGVLAC